RTFDVDPSAKIQAAAEVAFAAFPRLARIATTQRSGAPAGPALGRGPVARNEPPRATRPFGLGAVVDRIGAGDAFAAGLLHALMAGQSDQAALDFATAAACAKHA